jgi:hypothetical protein
MAIKYGENQEKNRGWLMTMLRVLLQGPGCSSIYEWCGCAKKKEAKNRGWLMTHVGCPVSGSRVHFQIWKVWLCKNENIWADFHIWKCTLDPQHSASNRIATVNTRNVIISSD